MSNTMMRSAVIGNIGETRRLTHNGEPFLSVTVAIDVDSVENATPEWVELVLGKGYLNLEPYLKKGRKVYAEGRSRIARFKKSDGTEGAVAKIRVKEFNLL